MSRLECSMDDGKTPRHWIDQYASNGFQWQQAQQNGCELFYRPLGLIEYAFDTDGRYLEGRSDMNALLELEIRMTLSENELRERVLLAWTRLRNLHVLLQAKAVHRQAYMSGVARTSGDVYFVVQTPRSQQEALKQADECLVYLEDYYSKVDALQFWNHSQNGKRILNTEKSLVKIFVLPMQQLANGNKQLRMLMVASHQITEGLTSYAWMNHFVELLNTPSKDLRADLEDIVKPTSLSKRLPLPQEALYPPISGSRARQRWFWLLTRILRHVRQPLPAAFENPLKLRKVLGGSVAYPRTYDAVLDYSEKPPTNSFPCLTLVPLRLAHRLHALCREAKVSVGAGLFALVGIVMMEMHALREPDIALEHRKPFIAGFPLNPRPFFNHTSAPDSLMLAFGDNVLLPFLPTDLDLNGRIRLLARQAHRQLALYQKRSKAKADEAGVTYMGSRGAGRLLANQYIGSIERADSLLPPHLRTGVKPQGGYPTSPNLSGSTCGVSSVGRRENLIKSGIYDLGDETKDFVADFRNLDMNVRPRDSEFLVGIGGSDHGIYVCCSIDGNTFDPALVEEWSTRLKTILESDSSMAKL